MAVSLDMVCCRECAKWILTALTKKASVRIDATIKSTGKLMFFPLATVWAIQTVKASLTFFLFSATELSVLKSLVFSPVKETVCT